MSATVNIPARAFAAAIKCASKQDVRYYLNGVYLDFPKGRIVATNGHIMFIGQIESAALSPVIVSRETVELALKSMTKRARDDNDVEVIIDGAAIEIVTSGTVNQSGVRVGATSFKATAIDGRFPDYEQVVVREVSGTTAQFDADLVATCADALRTYTAQYTHIAWQIQHNGDSASLMTGTNCLCVVMPCRTGRDADTDWYFGPTPAVAAAA